jgi:hypothetical protein
MRVLAIICGVLLAQPALAENVGPIPYSNLGQPDGPAKLDQTGKLAISSGAQAIYEAIYPGVTFSDWVSASFVNTQTSLTQQTGVAAYFRNQAAASGGSINAVGLFTAGTAEVDGAASWGVNTLLQDAASRSVGSGTGRILVNEFDFNVMNPDTQVIGMSVGGNSLAQPATANAFIVNPLGAGIKWGGAFVSIDGATNYALAIGTMVASGIDVPSQLATLVYRDHTGTKQQANLQAVSAGSGSGGFLSLTSSASNVDLSLGARLLYSGGVVMQGGGSGVFVGLGAAVPTADRASQHLYFNYRDHNNTSQTGYLQASSSGSGSSGALMIGGSGTALDLVVGNGGLTVSGGLKAAGLPVCAATLASGSVCRDSSTVPATLKVAP